MVGFIDWGHKGSLVMGGPAQIWAARSADTDARLTRAGCAQSTRPHQATSSHTLLGPELPKHPGHRPCRGDPRGHAWEALKEASVDWSAQEKSVGDPGPSWAPAGIHPQTSFVPDSSAFRPPCLCSCCSSCLEHHHSESSPWSPVPPLPAPPKVLLSPAPGGFCTCRDTPFHELMAPLPVPLVT